MPANEPELSVAADEPGPRIPADEPELSVPADEPGLRMPADEPGVSGTAVAPGTGRVVVIGIGSRPADGKSPAGPGRAAQGGDLWPYPVGTSRARFSTLHYGVLQGR